MPETVIGSAISEQVGYLPAAAVLGVFVWTELAVDPAPRALLALVAAYAVAQLVAGTRFGPGWYAHGDGFEAYSELLGRLAPVGRDADGRLRARSPRAALAATPSTRGLLAVLAVVVGGHLFHTLAATPLWSSAWPSPLPVGYRPL